MACSFLTSAQVHNHSFEFDGETRSYIVFLPQNYNGSEPFPAVLNLHGYYQSGEEQMEFSGMNSVADTAGFIVVYPDAIDSRWNSGIGENPNYPTPDVDDVGFIDLLIDSLFQQYSVDHNRVYACGISNGGFMSLKLACQLEDRLAAVASVAGVVSVNSGASCSAEFPMPLLYFHGTEDNIIPFYGGETGWYAAEETLDFWTEINFCSNPDTVLMPDLDPQDDCTVEKITYQCNDGGGVTFFKILNGGHTWPSSTYPLNPAIVGNTNYDINASVEIWNFFKNYYQPSTGIENALNSANTNNLVIYPNPVTDRAAIEFQMNEPGSALLKVTDVSGRLAGQKTYANLQKGHHSVEWSTIGLEKGAYFISLITGSNVMTKTIIIAK